MYWQNLILSSWLKNNYNYHLFENSIPNSASVSVSPWEES